MPNKYLTAIIKFYRANKRLPSYSELIKSTGLKSKNAIHKIINKLVTENYLARDDKNKITPGRKFLELPILGTVEAGFPSPAEEELCDTMSLEEYLIKKKEATYMLKVQGDSMTGAGIMPGDLLLVERGRNPKNGDVVVAEVDGQWTLKYFQSTQGRVTLIPANTKYKPITPINELKIAAIVVGCVRKY